MLAQFWLSVKKKKDPIGAFGVLDPGKAAELAGEKNRQLATISWWGKFVKSWSYLGGIGALFSAANYFMYS